MPGVVKEVRVAPGDPVRQGEALLILEAMKMENEIRAPRDGVVKTVAVTAGAPVEKGALLLTLDSPQGP
ncbi:MAG: acetyl-CoA carboxylase biotin carboxyl carrier protein subunit [Planctomycetota bacterium]